MSAPRRKLLKPLIRIIVLAIVCAGLGLTIRDAVVQLQDDSAKRELLHSIRWSAIGLAACLYAASLFPSALYWLQILRQWRLPVELHRAVAGHIQGHLGKYVPGKAMVVVLRVAAVARPGVDPFTATVAVFVETLTMMAVGAAWAGIIIASADVPPFLVVLACGLVVASALPTAPPLFRLVLKKISRGRAADTPWEAYRWSTCLAGWAWMSLTWVLTGGAFVAIVYGIVPTASGSDLLIAAAAMGLAVVAGFVSLLPGGAGVREWILAAVLAPRIGAAEALTAALLARMVFLSVEMVAGGASATVLWRSRSADKIENRSH